MVTISTRGYNVAKVGVNGVIDVDTPTNVGTKKDFSAIVDFAKTGYLILRTKFKKNGQTFMFDGSVDCEIQEDGSVFFSTLTEENDGDDVTIQTLTGTFSVSGANCVMTISEAEVGGGGSSGDGEYVEAVQEHGDTVRNLLHKLYERIDASKVTTKSRCVLFRSGYQFIIPIYNIRSSQYYCCGTFSNGETSVVLVGLVVGVSSPVYRYQMSASGTTVEEISENTGFTAVRFYY